MPFDYILSGGSHNGLELNSAVRILRIGRMYKLIKLTRLLKMLRIVKDRSRLLKYVNEMLKIGAGFERLFFLMFLFIMLSHIVSCLWVLTHQFEGENTSTWIDQMNKNYGDEISPI